MDRKELLASIKELLQTAYGDRLKGVILYGSEARGDARVDSDFDLFVLLEGPVDFGKDLRFIIETLYHLQLEVIRPIHAMPVSALDFDSDKYRVYREAKTEGIWA